MMRLLVLIFGLVVLQIVAADVEELAPCVTKEECLADVNNITQIVSERFNQRIDRDNKQNELLLKTVKSDVIDFNNLVKNNSKSCHKYLLDEVFSVFTIMDHAYLECRQEIEDYPELDTEKETRLNALEKEKPAEDEKEEWTRQFCEVYPEVMNHHCGYDDHHYDVLKNRCDIDKVFQRLYVNPWKECLDRLCDDDEE